MEGRTSVLLLGAVTVLAFGLGVQSVIALLAVLASTAAYRLLRPATTNTHDSRPPPGVVSHVTVRVRKLAPSARFYESFGMERLEEEDVKGTCLLRVRAAATTWQPRIVLVEDPEMPPRGASHFAGMTRLCLFTTDVGAETSRLAALGLVPMAPTAETNVGKISAYCDPDGFIVYIIEFKYLIGWAIRLVRAWYGSNNHTPSPFHLTVNVTDAAAANVAFETLGFAPVSDQTSSQVAYGLLPAFGVDAEATEIEHIRLGSRAGDHFMACIMQYNVPKTERKGDELKNSMTVAVADAEAVADSLRRAREAGLRVEDAARRRLPAPLGWALVGAAFVDGSRVEFCCFEDSEHDSE
jgi:catechol 2,3-dioxygenase-like lactoylglutathione lyase family enzyme